MKQHPVPQNISSYQFRLVGEMTLKQFLELATGLLLGYITFYLNIPGLIKWPLLVFFVLGGLALAFLPIQERPLDRWIINFIKSIYSPTVYVWKKDNPPPEILQKKQVRPVSSLPTPASIKDKKVLTEYLQTMPQARAIQSADQEEKKLVQIRQLLKESPAAPPQPTTPPTTVRPATPVSAKTQTPAPKTDKLVEPARPIAPPMQVESIFPAEEKLKPSLRTMFPNQIPLPKPSDVPNVLIGMVTTSTDRILPHSLIEITDKDGVAIRALKANDLGQFFTASPLNNGEYQIKTEHPDYQFDIIKFKTAGKIVPALKIKARPKPDEAFV